MRKGSLEGPYWEARELVHELPPIIINLVPAWETNGRLYFDAYYPDSSAFVADVDGIQQRRQFLAEGDLKQWAHLHATAPHRLKNLQCEVSIRPHTPYERFADWYQEKFGEWFGVRCRCTRPLTEIRVADGKSPVALSGRESVALVLWQPFAAYDQMLSNYITSLFAQTR